MVRSSSPSTSWQGAKACCRQASSLQFPSPGRPTSSVSHVCTLQLRFHTVAASCFLTCKYCEATAQENTWLTSAAWFSMLQRSLSARPIASLQQKQAVGAAWSDDGTAQRNPSARHVPYQRSGNEVSAVASVTQGLLSRECAGPVVSGNPTCDPPCRPQRAQQFRPLLLSTHFISHAMGSIMKSFLHQRPVVHHLGRPLPMKVAGTTSRSHSPVESAPGRRLLLGPHITNTVRADRANVSVRISKHHHRQALRADLPEPPREGPPSLGVITRSMRSDDHAFGARKLHRHSEKSGVNKLPLDGSHCSQISVLCAP